MNWLHSLKRSLKFKKRAVIIHNHNFKNAGTTIDWALARNFGNDFVDHRDYKNMLRDPAYLGTYLLENPNIQALSTHHLRLPLPFLDNVKLIKMMLLRHPIERVTSVYNFERKQTQSETLGARYARDHNIRDYILWRMRFDVPPTIRNFHVFRCLPTSVSWQKEFGESELIKAKAFIDSLEMLGFVEFFDESMILFEKFLSTFFRGIDLSYKMQNIGQQPNESLESRIEALRKEIGESAFMLLMDRNRADLDLYEYARRVFQMRLSQINTLDATLEDFRKRCRQIESGWFIKCFHGLKLNER
jgi:hypothetical protein